MSGGLSANRLDKGVDYFFRSGGGVQVNTSEDLYFENPFGSFPWNQDPGEPSVDVDLEDPHEQPEFNPPTLQEFQTALQELAQGNTDPAEALANKRTLQAGGMNIRLWHFVGVAAAAGLYFG